MALHPDPYKFARPVTETTETDDLDRPSELVVLASDDGRNIGTMPKAEVHTAETPLHFAFSVFVFNGSGELLLQKRSFGKRTWPGIWSNSCCGHPMPGESVEDAARRRLAFELGLSVERLKVYLPKFRYRAEFNGIVENEICPVMAAVAVSGVSPNPDEVAEVKWVTWRQAIEIAESLDADFSPWARLEIKELIKNEEFVRFSAGLRADP